MENQMALILDGKKLAEQIEEELKKTIKDNIVQTGRPPGLAVVRVGEDPASAIYVSKKEKACLRTGIATFGSHFEKTISQEALQDKISELNENIEVDGILLQLPLPRNLKIGPLLSAIHPDKDADGLHNFNLGRLIKGERGPRSCTPAGIMELLNHHKIQLEGKRAVVIGRSILVGKPMALMLEAANSTVTIAHSHTKDLASLTRQADVLVVAAGIPKLIGSEHIKRGAVVIDVGINRLQGNQQKPKICGDVKIEEVAELVKAITPVPGGVGPMTVSMLLVNTVNSWKNHCGLT